MLLLEQGFEQPCTAGKGCEVPWLLSRQSVVMGLSNGLILAQPAALVPRALDGHPSSLSHELATSFMRILLRNSLPQGRLLSGLLNSHAADRFVTALIPRMKHTGSCWLFPDSIAMHPGHPAELGSLLSTMYCSPHGRTHTACRL